MQQASKKYSPAKISNANELFEVLRRADSSQQETILNDLGEDVKNIRGSLYDIENILTMLHKSLQKKLLAILSSLLKDMLSFHTGFSSFSSRLTEEAQLYLLEILGENFARIPTREYEFFECLKALMPRPQKKAVLLYAENLKNVKYLRFEGVPDSTQVFILDTLAESFDFDTITFLEGYSPITQRVAVKNYVATRLKDVPTLAERYQKPNQLTNEVKASKYQKMFPKFDPSQKILKAWVLDCLDKAKCGKSYVTELMNMLDKQTDDTLIKYTLVVTFNTWAKESKTTLIHGNIHFSLVEHIVKELNFSITYKIEKMHLTYSCAMEKDILIEHVSLNENEMDSSPSISEDYTDIIPGPGKLSVN